MKPSECSTPFQAYERLLVDLATAMAAKPTDRARIDRIHEEMEGPEKQLSSAELRLLNHLSGDLYMLEQSEVFEPIGMTQEELQKRIRLAFAMAQWEGLLALLRRPTMLFKPAQVAHMRSRAYAELGCRTAAWAFADFASGRDRENQNLRALCLDSQFRAGFVADAVARAEKEIQNPSSTRFTIAAATILFLAMTRDLPCGVTPELAADRLAEAIRNEEATVQPWNEVLAGACAVLGMLLERANGPSPDSEAAFFRFLDLASGTGLYQRSSVLIAKALTDRNRFPDNAIAVVMAEVGAIGGQLRAA